MAAGAVTSDELELHKRISANIAYYRKLSGMTQTELAERINYSDKSVSKWERAGGVPDIYVITQMANLFGVSVNDLVSENAALPPPDPKLRDKHQAVICLQFIVGVWLAATALFAALMLYAPQVRHPWVVFVAAVPASAVVCVVFATLWWGRPARLFSVSALAWTVALCAFLLMLDNSWAFLIFMVCAVAQVLVLLWFLREWLAEKRRRFFTMSSSEQPPSSKKQAER